MQIKQASTAETSTTLAAAKKTDLWAIGMIAASAIAGAVWFTQPKLRELTTPYLAGAGLGVGTAIRFGIIKIEKGRGRLGDLDEAVEHVALLAPGQAEILDKLKPVIEGHLDVTELPQVRAAIECGVMAAKPDMHEQVREMAMRQASDFRGSGIVPPPTRVLDPSWEAPI